MSEAVDRAARKAEADFWCDGCDDDVEPTTKYECNNCGNEFTHEDEGSNRCPDCGKFAAKLAGDYCPDCGEELEAQKGDAS